MNVTEYIKAERVPPCSIASIESTGEIFATFRTSAGWKIEEKILQGPIPGTRVTAEDQKNDLVEMERQIGRYVRNGSRGSSSWRWSLLKSKGHMTAAKHTNFYTRDPHDICCVLFLLQFLCLVKPHIHPQGLIRIPHATFHGTHRVCFSCDHCYHGL